MKSELDTSRMPVIIIGNGPSLRGFDLRQLQDCITIGMNSAYRYWNTINWYPTYYCCLDTVVIKSHAKEIYELIQNSNRNGIRLFLLQRIIANIFPDLHGNPKVIWFDNLVKDFPFNIFQSITTGGGAALFTMALGFRRLCLLGVDCNYVERIDEAFARNDILEMSATPEINPNYFFDSYQLKGDKFNVPNSVPNLHISSWREISELANQIGTEIINCNGASNVRLFPFAEWENISHAFEDKEFVRKNRDKAKILINASKKREFTSTDINLSYDYKIEINGLNKKLRYILALVIPTQEAPLLPILLRYKIDGKIRYCSHNANSTPYIYYLEIKPRWLKTSCTVEITSCSTLEVSNNAGDCWNGSIHLFNLSPGNLPAMPLFMFDGKKYLLDHPDVSKAVDEKKISSAYEHYVTYGHYEGRNVHVINYFTHISASIDSEAPIVAGSGLQ